jgi:predicted DNA-binding transcriptional regulator YafY
MLFAHCHLKNDQRCFKIDRILSSTPLRELTPTAEQLAPTPMAI